MSEMDEYDLMSEWVNALSSRLGGEVVPGSDPERARGLRDWADELRSMADQMDSEADRYDDQYIGGMTFTKYLPPASEITTRFVHFGPKTSDTDDDVKSRVIEIRRRTTGGAMSDGH